MLVSFSQQGILGESISFRLCIVLVSSEIILIKIRYLIMSKNLYEDGIEKKLVTKHHRLSSIMPNGDPRDGTFYHTLLLILDS